METEKTPVVIVGSGIAGLLTALKLSKNQIPTIIVTKTRLTENSSMMAQGGIAAVMPGNSEDSIEAHVKDTLIAGAGLSEESVARSILKEGHLAIEDLLELGVPFDRVDGKLAFTKEGAHSTSRILHAGGDATGRSIQDTLIAMTQADPNITVMEMCIATRLLVHDERCVGIEALGYAPDSPLRPLTLLANYTILSTGGIGYLYAQTSNPSIATGDGIALAYEAGAQIQDLEFIQFHPTAFWSNGQVRFLISEALRGEGGILRNMAGETFAYDYHSHGELAPRDIVTRAIDSQMAAEEAQHVWLDMTHLPPETIETRFPTILKACLNYGVDIRKDWIPVAPAAHYGMGGVLVDDHGKSSVENLLAVGEVVSTGLHGANRLASNSLLECVVLARRVAHYISENPVPLPEMPVSVTFSCLEYRKTSSKTLTDLIYRLRNLMWEHVGIRRNGQGLKKALLKINTLEHMAQDDNLLSCVPDGVEFKTMCTTSRLICEAAMQREESRGAHYREDFTPISPVTHHSIQTRAQQSQETMV